MVKSGDLRSVIASVQGMETALPAGLVNPVIMMINDNWDDYQYNQEDSAACRFGQPSDNWDDDDNR